MQKSYIEERQMSQLKNPTIIVKVTNQCNLACNYCYGECSPSNNGIMNYATLENLIRKIFTYCVNNGTKSISIIWHGGEPLLQHIDFYKQVIHLEKGYNVKTYNYLQTNGTLLTKENVIFFKDNEFKIGISLDGPQEFNDQNRIYMNGMGTYTNIMRGIDILRNHDIPVGVLSVISKANIYHLTDVYEFLKVNSFDAKINPLIKIGRATKMIDRLIISPEEWATNKIQLVKIWLRDSNPVHLDCIENCMVNYYTQGTKSGECHSKYSCQEEFLAVNYNGDVYPCGEFCDFHEYIYGNINEDSVEDILMSPLRLQLMQRSIQLLSCLDCSYYSICYGGCMFKAFAWRGTVYAQDFSCHYYKSLYRMLDDMVQSPKTFNNSVDNLVNQGVSVLPS